MIDPDRYAISVRKTLVDGEDVWRATVRELPDVAEFGDTREEAVALARDAIEDLQRAALEDGSSFPDPIEDEEEYTGRVTLRMSTRVHRAAAERAIEQKVSLNSYIVTCVTLDLGASRAAAGAITASPVWAWSNAGQALSNQGIAAGKSLWEFCQYQATRDTPPVFGTDLVIQLQEFNFEQGGGFNTLIPKVVNE